MRHDQRVKLLYKTILRLHKGLPAEIQPLGNTYAKDEFKRHKNCNAAEAQVFIVEWTNYAVQLSRQLGLGIQGKPADKVGVQLDDKELDHLRDEQVVQLYELMKAATQNTATDEEEKEISQVEIIDNHKKKPQ